MSLRNEIELTNTREKLRRLEQRYEKLRADTSEDDRVRSLTMESLASTIGQFKDEISQYESGQRSDTKKRRVLNIDELSNTRAKLIELEELYRSVENDTDGNEELREASGRSLMRMINQLKEDVIWTEAHQPSPTAKSAS